MGRFFAFAVIEGEGGIGYKHSQPVRVILNEVKNQFAGGCAKEKRTRLRSDPSPSAQDDKGKVVHPQWRCKAHERSDRV